MRLVHVLTDYIRRSILTTKGDLIVRGDAQPERLAGGALDTYLRGKGAGQLPAYEAEPTLPACRVWKTAAQSIPSGIWSKVLFDTVSFDTVSGWDNINNRYISDRSGKYQINSNIILNDLLNGQQVVSMIYVNGIQTGGYNIIRPGSAGASVIIASDLLGIALNDYVELYVYQTAGVAKPVVVGWSARTYLTINLMRE